MVDTIWQLRSFETEDDKPKETLVAPKDDDTPKSVEEYAKKVASYTVRDTKDFLFLMF